MPRKTKSAKDRLLELLEKDATDAELQKLQEVRTELENEQSLDDKSIEAEAVLLYFNTKGAGFKNLKCPSCGLIFAYKYSIPKHKMCCSNECRKAELKKIGIVWNPNKTPEERWGMTHSQKGSIPLIVPPSALTVLQDKLQEV